MLLLIYSRVGSGGVLQEEYKYQLSLRRKIIKRGFIYFLSLIKLFPL